MNVDKLLVSNYFLANRINSTNNSIKNINQKLSTGKKINYASDGPSDILRINRLNSQIRCSQVAQRNIQDGISFLQVREAAINEMISITQRIKELSTRYKNDILNLEDKKIIEIETSELLTNINEIKQNTKFNGLNVFEDKKLTIQHGANPNETTNIIPPQFCISPNEDGTFNFYNWERITIKNEINNKNIKEFASIYLTDNASIIKEEIKNIEFTLQSQCERIGTSSSMDLKLEKIMSSKDNLYNITGTWTTGSNTYQVSGIAQYNNDTKSFNGSWHIGHDYTYGFSAKVDNIEDLPSISNMQIQHYPNSRYEKHDVTISNFKYSKEELTISLDQFKNLINNPVEGTNIKINYPDRTPINLITKDGKTTFKTNHYDSILKSFNIEETLNSDLIDNNILNPLNEYKSYIGIKTNELERKMNLEQIQEVNNVSFLGKIEDIDTAKELLAKTKEEMILQTNIVLFQNNLENYRNYISQLLR